MIASSEAGAVGTGAALSRAWEELAERADASPFLRPGWFEAWTRAFAGGAGLEALEVREGELLTGLVPILRRGEDLVTPTNWHTPLFGPLGVDQAAREQVLAQLLSGGERISITHFGGAGTEPADLVASASRAGRRVAIRRLPHSPVIQLPDEFAVYEASLSKNRRKALRRHRRKLEQLGKLEFEVHDGRQDLERLLGDLFAVEASGWKGEQGTAISSRPETQLFYTEVAQWAAERGWLRLAFHRLGGRAVACDFVLEHGGTWYTLKAGYENELRSHGPGALLLRDEIAYCCERGISRIELLGEEDEFKASWADGFTERARIRIFPPTPAGVGNWAASAAWEWARPPLRDLKRRLSR